MSPDEWHAVFVGLVALVVVTALPFLCDRFSRSGRIAASYERQRRRRWRRMGIK